MLRTRITQVITLLFVVAVIAVLVINIKNKQEIVKVGDEAYNFALEDMTDDIYELADYRGKPVVINFFSTWCESCHEQSPGLIEFEKEYGEEIQVFTIVRAESQRMLNQYIERYGPQYGERLFIFDYDMAVSERYGIVGQPETVIIDEAGVVTEHIVGPISGSELANKMRAYIAYE